MIRLEEIGEHNFAQALRLSLDEEQLAFCADAAGILARGYAFRESNARVWAIVADGAMVGLALVRDLDEEPACYDLQEFMIDRRQQNRGYGRAALALILERLRAEGRYPCVEVCVHRADAAALRVYQDAGFADTGYQDPDLPDFLNLRCPLIPENTAKTERG